MPLTLEQQLQAYADWSDYWRVAREGFDVPIAQTHLSLVTAIPLTANPRIAADKEIVDPEGFLLNQAEQEKIRALGLNPDTGIVMTDAGTRGGLEDYVCRSLEHLGIKIVEVQSDAEQPAGNHGLFLDVTQPGYIAAITALHRKWSNTADQIINRTESAGDFMDFLESQNHNYAIADGTIIAADSVREAAQREVRYQVAARMTSLVQNELESRSFISKRRFERYLEEAESLAPHVAFKKLLQNGHFPSDESSRETLMNCCMSADAQPLIDEIRAQFDACARRTVGGMARVAQDK